MDPLIAGGIIFVVFLILIAAGLKIAFAGMIIGFIGIFMLKGWQPAGAVLGSVTISQASSYIMSVIPLFVFMGYFGARIGIIEEVFNVCRRWIGFLPGGLAMATTLACAAFGAISGSSTAAVVIFGRTAIPEMDKSGYDRHLSVGVVTASGTFAQMIPPSTLAVVYASLANVSAGKVLIAGFVPGILNALLYAVAIYLWCRINPKVGPAGQSYSLKDRINSLGSLWAVGIIFLAVFLGLYTGVFTPTEAGAAGVTVMLLVAMVKRRLSWQVLKKSLVESAETTGVIFLILIGVVVLSRGLAYTGLFNVFVQGLVDLARGSQMLVLIVMMLVYLILGCFLGVMAMILITLPIFLPILAAMHVDLVWFGILVLMQCEIAMLTPPIGGNVFVANKVTGMPLHEAFRAIAPFVALDIVLLAVLMAFPQVVLFLPSRM